MEIGHNFILYLYLNLILPPAHQHFGVSEHHISITSIVQVALGGQTIVLLYIQVLIPNSHELGLYPAPRRFVGVESEAEARNLRKSSLQLGVHADRVLKGLQNLLS